MNKFFVFLTSLSCIFGESNKLSVYDIYPEVWKELFDNKIKRDKLKYEFSYSDFEDISLNSSSGSSKVEADADALTFKVSYGF